MTRKVIEIKSQTPIMVVTWVLNNICTNKCDYCPSVLHSGTNHNYNWDQARQFIDVLLSKYNCIKLAISGGEPTVSPWFPELVKMFSDRGHSVGVTTNGARTVSYYDKIAPDLSYIVMSWHPSFEDPDFVEKALACAKHTWVTVSVMMDSRHFDRSLAMYKELQKHKSLGVEAVRITSWTPGITVGSEYTPEQIDIINKLEYVSATEFATPKNITPDGPWFIFDDGYQSRMDAQELINTNQTNFVGWECDIGLESLYLHYDGELRMGNCRSAPIIGSLQDIDNIKWPTKSFICPQTHCRCTSDVNVSKRKLPT